MVAMAGLVLAMASVMVAMVVMVSVTEVLGPCINSFARHFVGIILTGLSLEDLKDAIDAGWRAALWVMPLRSFNKPSKSRWMDSLAKRPNKL